ncbi:helix-turn-helix transcriptional regulator [Cohnella rhizosphaerae]|uniref:Helix-turn-helix transcriptional regulator n=1 Tax=Cohnella rhizosphaerae TaxID=1457232 RepID=A0A9X4KXG3_9BACL|nr:helix-turn-helix transcriptional regulator [Cohnella rhizosphaerae]MDG0810054.1 helix-turn-helix transcriptional regulator [Cohnella rhizosphaerae]
MSYTCEQLAEAFEGANLSVHGVYRTVLAADSAYTGHVERPTSKCAVIIGLSGQADFIFDGAERHTMEPGVALIGGLNRRLEIRTGGEAFEYGLVHYLPEPQIGEAAQMLIAVSPLRVGADPEQRLLLERLLQAAALPDSMMRLEKKTLFYQLVNRLLFAARTVRHGPASEMVRDTLELIHAYYAEPITLARLAERHGLGPKYFSTQFRRFMGMGPIDYLIRYRMNRAEELLATGTYPVHAVARSVGYPDAYYFSRLYKKHKGQSPGEIGLKHRRNRPS